MDHPQGLIPAVDETDPWRSGRGGRGLFARDPTTTDATDVAVGSRKGALPDLPPRYRSERQPYRSVAG